MSALPLPPPRVLRWSAPLLLALAVLYLIAAIVLLVRPAGLFGRA